MAKKALFAAFVVSTLQSVFSCGIEWKEPAGYFSGVDYVGNALVVKNITAMSLESGKAIPIFAIFGSEVKSVSPYLGYGWKIPLLESKFVQRDENTFQFEQPDGWSRTFWRDKRDPQLLHGQGNWRALIQGNTITAWADCGGKVVFSGGKISALEARGSSLSFIYQDAKISQIRSGNSVLLSTEFDKDGDLAAINVEGKRITFGIGQVPVVQRIADQSVVSSVEKAVSQIRGPGIDETFEYSLDGDMNPVIKDGERLFAFDPVSRKILRDGDWVYKIDQSKVRGDSVPVRRTNSLGESEFWHRNAGKGETITEKDGTETRVTQFVSGVLNGKIRSIKKSRGEELISEEKFAYDEKGNLLKSQDAEGLTQFLYDESGRLSEKRINGKLIFKRQYNDDAYTDFYSSGMKKTYSNTKSGIIVHTTNSDGRSSLQKIRNISLEEEDSAKIREQVKSALLNSGYLDKLNETRLQ